MTVTGTPTLTLNDGAIATYVSGSGTNALTFSYTVAATDSTVPTLAITQVNLPSGATVKDAAGNAANLSGAVTTFPGLSIDPPPVVVSVSETPSTGDLNAGKTVTLTLALNDVVTVTRWRPDADAQRWRHRDLYRRLRHQCADLQLYRWGWAEHGIAGCNRPHA